MANKKASQTIRTTIIGTERNTFEITKEYVGEKVAGDEAAIIQLYPTVGIGDIGMTDSTTLHLQNKMGQLGWSKVHMVNLFSQVWKRKPLAGDLKAVDRENIAYVKHTITDVGKRGKIIVAWGNSHSANPIVNETKKELLEFLLSTQPGNVFQLIAENMLTETEGTHILFLGLRYADDGWSLADYPVKAQLEKITTLVQKRQAKKNGEKSCGGRNKAGRGKETYKKR